jgi:hypothetical protein
MTNMRTVGSLLAISAALLVLAPAGTAADGPYLSLSETGYWDDNVTNATSGDGILGAFFFDSGANLAWIQSVDFSTIVSASMATTAEACTPFGRLDNVSLRPRLELRRKLGLGPLAPVLYAGVGGDGVAFVDPERSIVEGDLLFGASQRIDDALQVQVDGRLGAYEARDDVFSGSYASLEAALNWDIDATWRVKLIGGWRNGDLVADYAAMRVPGGWESIDPGAGNISGPWHYVTTFNAPFVAYRESAQTWSYGAGISPAIGRNTSLSLQYMHFDTPAYDRYLNRVVSVSLVHHF